MSPEPGRRRTAHLWARLGVRARITVMFGVGALLFSASIGWISYFVVRHVLVGEQENSALHQAYVNAAAVRTKLLYSGINGSVTDLTIFTAIRISLRAADTGAATRSSTSPSHSVFEWRGTWTADYPLYSRTAIPSGLRGAVGLHQAATQTYVLDGSPVITVGVALPSIRGEYFDIFSEDHLAHTLRVLALALFGAGAFTTVVGAAVGRWASSGSLRPLTSVSRAAVAIAGGRLDTRLPAVPDDPDLQGLTSSFNRMVDQLQERIERETRFTSDVSHELRSPLTTMGASIEVLEGHAEELSSTAQRALGLLSADLRRFQRMVGELLEISRSDAGSADVSLEEVDPGELARRSVAAAARSLPPDVATPVVDVDPALEGTRMVVDKRRFERVMTNLLENAAHYGGGATRVTVAPGAAPEPRGGDGRWRRTGRQGASPSTGGRRRPEPAGAPGTPGPSAPTGVGSVVFSVEDRGPGIPEGERNRVFQRFYRGQASGQRGWGEGTGLGLALVAEHVRLHGGKVWAEEVPGGGARFNVELPASAPEDPDDRHGATADNGRQAAPWVPE